VIFKKFQFLYLFFKVSAKKRRKIMKKITRLPKNLFIILITVLLTSVIGYCKTSPQKHVIIRLTYENNPNEPIDQGAHKWAELVKKRSNGTIEIQIFPSSQLGSKLDLVEQMKLGANIITISDGSYLMDYVPDMGIVMAPYLLNNFNQMFKLTKSDWWKEQSALLEKKGLKIVSNNWIYGDRHLLTKKPVYSPNDLKGMKIRVPNNQISVKMFNLMGAASTPMALADVYTALQQGVCDGVENPLPVLYANKFQEICKNLTLTAHQKNFSVFITGTKFFNALSNQQKRTIMESGDEAALFSNKRLEVQTARMISEFKKSGCKIIKVNTSKFSKKVLPLYEEYETSGKWTPGLYKKIQSIVK
jgi:tripartite ATP-independent transporter DctP family solute receptor